MSYDIKAELPTSTLVNPGLTPLMLNHAAWITKDIEGTADFYQRIMGMEIASTVLDDSVPSTGDAFPYFHIFFRMADGSTIAFFDAPSVPSRAQPSHPAYDIFDHIALQARDRHEVDAWRKWLLQNGIDVVGPTDHNGLIYSIYFHDPNDLRLEITTPLDPKWNSKTREGRTALAEWCEVKRQAEATSGDVHQALLRHITNRRDMATALARPLTAHETD